MQLLRKEVVTKVSMVEEGIQKLHDLVSEMEANISQSKKEAFESEKLSQERCKDKEFRVDRGHGQTESYQGGRVPPVPSGR